MRRPCRQSRANPGPIGARLDQCGFPCRSILLSLMEMERDDGHAVGSEWQVARRARFPRNVANPKLRLFLGAIDACKSLF